MARDNTQETEKRLVAEAAAGLVEDDMHVGLGTGSTVGYFLPALAARELRDLVCVATSVDTAEAAAQLGFRVETFDRLDHLDIAVDGADQVAPDGWVVKGGGAAHTREKVVAAAAKRFIIIVTADKCVERIEPPVPVEVLAFGATATLQRLGTAERRGIDRSPDGNVIADYLGPIDDPGELASKLAGFPGIVEHGLFAPHLISDLLIGRADVVEHRRMSV